MKYLKEFEEFIGDNITSYTIEERLGSALDSSADTKLGQAADIILRFLNRKLKNNFKQYPWVETVNGLPSIILYSSTDDSAVRINGGGKFKGIVGSLDYFEQHWQNKSTFTISSDNFPIVLLLDEFIKIITSKSYAKEVESLVESYNLLESRKAISQDMIKIISDRLSKGESAANIARDTGVSYGMILQIKRGRTINVEKPKAETRNEQTLADKVKILDETLEDLYEISRRVAAGAFNSLMISGRAGTGKTFSVTKALDDEGLRSDEDYMVISGAVSTVMMYKKLYQFRDKVLVFDDCDAVFRDENGRNILKAALDTKKIRRISYLKKSNSIFDPKDFENDPQGEFNAIENGMVPSYFDFSGRVIFISNLPKDKADPDGAIRSRSILIDVNPDDMTLMERIKILLPQLEPLDMPLADKEEIFEFMKRAKDVSMRTFVKAAGFKKAGLPNWERMAKRYL